METKIVKPDAAQIAAAGALIRGGETVAFPTETVYGLGASALDAEAAHKIYAAKGRPSDNPLIAHIAALDDARKLVEFTPLAEKLAAAYWPGPLTMVLRSRGVIPSAVTAGLPTLAVRFPSHPVAQKLIRAAGVPIAAPSANASGRPSPTLAEHVYEDLRGHIPLIIDGGAVEIGLESTIVDATGELPLLLRPGRITAEELRCLCGGLSFPDGFNGEHPPAPGMKYRHYAPQGEVLLARDWREAEAAARVLAQRYSRPPLLILRDDTAAELLRRGAATAEQVISLGQSEEDMAARLFAALREADSRGALSMVAERVDDAGLGLAIMNRLSKAAGKQ